MFDITDKKDCCGCSACVQRCPKECISMKEDGEGFLYPSIDSAHCIDCGLCEKVCPVIHQDTPREPKEVYAAKNPDEAVRRQSSSGGVFTMLAERTIEKGGAVFGARFAADWSVEHGYAETTEGLTAFQGSKYVQSCIGKSYKLAETFLKSGREVLFSGTPCQIAGLRHYLKKEYTNLLTVDFICHGVPSPGVFRQYIAEELASFTSQGGERKIQFRSSVNPPLPESDGLGRQDEEVKIEAISFRDKRLGWKKYSFALSLSKVSAAGEKIQFTLSTPLGRNVFLRGFLNNIYLRPSCYACAARHLKSGSDITLGDYWGIDCLLPDYDDDRGVSAVVVNSEKGAERLHRVHADLRPVPYADLLAKNPALLRSASVPDKRTLFFTEDGRTIHEKIKLLCRPTMKRRIRNLLSEFTRTALPPKTKAKIKQMIGKK